MKIILSAASKGGVGKSIVSINTGFAIKQIGLSAGILDTDLSMPAITKYLNLQDSEVETHRMIEPVEVEGVQLFSPGMVMDEDQPVLINSEQRERLVEQYIDKINWGVDYLVIDTPPGAMDELQYVIKKRKADLKGIIIVTTPSGLAISQVRRSIEMFKRMKAPLLGIIGNMMYYECPECHKPSDIFKNKQTNPVDQLAADFKLRVLAKLPMYPTIDEEPLHFVDLIAKGLKNVVL